MPTPSCGTHFPQDDFYFLTINRIETFYQRFNNKQTISCSQHSGKEFHKGGFYDEYETYLSNGADQRNRDRYYLCGKQAEAESLMQKGHHQ